MGERNTENLKQGKGNDCSGTTIIAAHQHPIPSSIYYLYLLYYVSLSLHNVRSLRCILFYSTQCLHFNVITFFPTCHF